MAEPVTEMDLQAGTDRPVGSALWATVPPEMEIGSLRVPFEAGEGA